MRTWPRLAVLAALGGCAQLAGIDDTSGAPDAAAPSTTSIDFEHLSIGATVEKAPQDLTGQMAAYLQYGDTGVTEVPALLGGTGNNTWSADLMDPTPVRVTLPNAVGPVIFDFPNLTIHAQTEAFEHPNPQPPIDGATVDINVTLDALPVPTDTFALRLIGPWLSHAIAAPVQTPKAPPNLTLAEAAFPYAMLTPNTAAPVAGFTAADVVMVLRYNATSTLTGWLEPDPADQGPTTSITGMMLANTADQTLDAKVDPMGTTARLATILPAGGATAQRYWVFAAPGADVAEASGIVLASAAIPAMSAMTSLAATFGNPFLAKNGWQSVVQYAASTTRQYDSPELGVKFTFASSLVHIEKFGAGQMLSQDAGLPNLISVNGAQMSIDGGTVTTPTAPVMVTVATDKMLDTALYGATLIELGAAPATPPALPTPTQIAVATVYSPSSTLRFPPALFVEGHTYVVQVQVFVNGFTSLATGDLRVRALPISTATHVSGAFKVVAL